MRIITKNGIIYNSLNISIIRDLIKSVKTLVAVVEDDRKLNYKDNVYFKEFIDDLTKEELNKGLEEVENICKENNKLDLLKEYYNFYYENNNDFDLLAKLKELKLFEINQKYNLEIDKVLKEYIPNTEILTWDIQETESRAFKENNYKDESLCPFMKKISTIRGYPLKDLCDKAIYKADLYRENIATLIGLRQSLQDKIEKVSSIEDLEKINFNEKRFEKVKGKLNAKH